MFDRRFVRTLAAIVFLLWIGHDSTGVAQDAWPEKFYNPKPLLDDLVLPMPCGGAMAFRRIDIPTDGLLDDRKLILGGRGEQRLFSEGPRYAYLAGGFSDPDDPARRFFYLGKYEVSAMQMAALGETCPKRSMRGRLPGTKVSWFDAVRFAHDYMGWLLEHAAEALPTEGKTRGFLRLPTETEWEFSARGGLAVSGSEFQEPVFPTPGGLHKFVWYEGPRSANGRLQLTGLLAPNPLGLHDMLGNADEIVLEPFRLNKLTRLHGQPGGFVVKGGNFLTSRSDIRTSHRQENARYGDHGPNRVATIGFRLALSVDVISSPEKLAGIKRAWSELPVTVTATSGAPPVNDPIAEIETIIKATTDLDLRNRLEQVKLIVGDTLSTLNSQRARSGRETVRLGTFLASKIRDDLKRVAGIRKIHEGRKKAGSDASVLARTKRSLETAQTTLQENFKYYADTVIFTVQEYADDLLKQQADALAIELESRGLFALEGFSKLFLSHIFAYRQTQTVDRETWLAEIKHL